MHEEFGVSNWPGNEFIGSLSGYLSVVTLTLAAYSLPNFTFAEVTDVIFTSSTWHGHTYFFWDGICGMGPAPLGYGLPTLMGELARHGLVSEQVFAFYLGATDRYEVGEGAELVLGGVDLAHYSGDFFVTPLTHTDSWRVALAGLKVDGETISSNKCLQCLG